MGKRRSVRLVPTEFYASKAAFGLASNPPAKSEWRSLAPRVKAEKHLPERRNLHFDNSECREQEVELKWR